MSGRVVIVTGADGGLGTFVTERFLGAGDQVFGASRKIQAKTFPNSNFTAVPTDFSDFNSVKNLADVAIERAGRIDVLVHTVGGFAAGAPIHETDEQTWALMRDQNLTSTYYVARAVVPHLQSSGKGRFIAVGSKAAEQPHANMGPYVIFKTALVTLVKTIALETAASGVRANLVLPGTMDTPSNRAAMPKVDPKTWVSPVAVANAIFWLAGDEASEVNGAAIPVSGREV